MLWYRKKEEEIEIPFKIVKGTETWKYLGAGLISSHFRLFDGFNLCVMRTRIFTMEVLLHGNTRRVCEYDYDL